MMTTHQESILDQFSRQAVSFSQSPGHTNEESLRLLMEMVGLVGEDMVLDVACGTGIVACAFARIARHVTGIDITPAMLDQAQRLSQQAGLTNVLWLQGDIETLPFPGDSFSLVLSRYAFHHFLNPGLVLSEMVRVCRPGGRVLIADGCPPSDKADAYNQFEKLFDPSHHRALTSEEFQQLMTDRNLRDVRGASYRMEMELERHLAASFPNPGAKERLRQLFAADVDIDRLGVGAHRKGEEIHYAYPVMVFVARKAGS